MLLATRQSTGGSEQGWSEHQTGDGRKFFHNEDVRDLQDPILHLSKAPKSLCSGLKSYLDQAQETGVSQWEKPDSLMTDSERIVNSTAWKQYRRLDWQKKHPKWLRYDCVTFWLLLVFHPPRIWDGRIFYHNKAKALTCTYTRDATGFQTRRRRQKLAAGACRQSCTDPQISLPACATSISLRSGGASC